MTVIGVAEKRTQPCSIAMFHRAIAAIVYRGRRGCRTGIRAEGLSVAATWQRGGVPFPAPRKPRWLVEFLFYFPPPFSPSGQNKQRRGLWVAQS